MDCSRPLNLYSFWNEIRLTTRFGHSNRLIAFDFFVRAGKYNFIFLSALRNVMMVIEAKDCATVIPLEKARRQEGFLSLMHVLSLKIPAGFSIFYFWSEFISAASIFSSLFFSYANSTLCSLLFALYPISLINLNPSIFKRLYNLA